MDVLQNPGLRLSHLFYILLKNIQQLLSNVHRRKDAVRVVVQGIMANFSKK